MLIWSDISQTLLMMPIVFSVQYFRHFVEETCKDLKVFKENKMDKEFKNWDHRASKFSVAEFPRTVDPCK